MLLLLLCSSNDDDDDAEASERVCTMCQMNRERMLAHSLARSALGALSFGLVHRAARISAGQPSDRQPALGLFFTVRLLCWLDVVLSHLAHTSQQHAESPRGGLSVQFSAKPYRLTNTRTRRKSCSFFFCVAVLYRELVSKIRKLSSKSERIWRVTFRYSVDNCEQVYDVCVSSRGAGVHLVPERVCVCFGVFLPRVRAAFAIFCLFKQN